jgi:hypothetical protein
MPQLKNETFIQNITDPRTGKQVDAPQTKILEGGTKDEIQIFD